MEQKIIICAWPRNEDYRFFAGLINKLELPDAKTVIIGEDDLCAADKNHGSGFKKIFLGPTPMNYAGSMLFFCLLPFHVLRTAACLRKAKNPHGKITLILSGLRERIIFSLAAKISKANVFWLALPGDDLLSGKLIADAIIKRLAASSQLIAVSGYQENDREPLKFKNTYSLRPAVTPIMPRQENMYQHLAHSRDTSYRKKFFTVGCLCALNDAGRLESVLKAIALARSVIPQIQAVIVGEGEEKKRLTWIAQKIGIENAVWFVGSNSPQKKWLESFDLFIEPSSSPSIASFLKVLTAMSSGLPAIMPAEQGFEAMVENERNGLIINLDDPEELSQGIIKLYRNPKLRSDIGRSGKETTLKKHSIEAFLGELGKILKLI